MHDDPLSRDLRKTLAPTMRMGLMTLAVFIGVFGMWAGFVPLAKGAMAPGSVSPDGNRRTVQHLEGGIIRELLVRDGQKVRQNDPLVVLQDLQVRGKADSERTMLWSLLAEQSRLQAEWSGADAIDFPAQLTENRDHPIAREAILTQEDILRSRRDSLNNERNIYEQQIKQLENQIGGLLKEIASIDEQDALIEEEIADVQTLLEKGLARKPRMLELQRTKAELAGRRARNVSDIARGNEAIAESHLEILRLEKDRRDEVNAALADLQSKIGASRSALDAMEDVLERTVIRAPVNGTVINLKFTTLNGVVGPGEAIMDIVPNRERLVINARVSPLDIDVTRAGLPANVYLSAYPRRTTPTIPARVEWVSADIEQDDVTGDSYYSARVVVLAEDLESLPAAVVLYPGMPTEVLIRTGERTALDYLLEPILSAMDRSFTET